jgi:hypothetical protein
VMLIQRGGVVYSLSLWLKSLWILWDMTPLACCFILTRLGSSTVTYQNQLSVKSHRRTAVKAPK